MKHLLLATSLMCSLVSLAQHWPTYIFQHDSIYKNAHVQTIVWKEDSTKRFGMFEADIDLNGHITKLVQEFDPTTFYEYDEKGKLLKELNTEGTAELVFDAQNRIVSKTFYSDDKVLTKKETITYNPMVMKVETYEDGRLVSRKKYTFETPTTIKQYSVDKGGVAGELVYTYENTYNKKGQIIKTVKKSMGDTLGEATYQYHSNGLLNTITIPPMFSLNENAKPEVQKLVYTFYE